MDYHTITITVKHKQDNRDVFISEKTVNTTDWDATQSMMEYIDQGFKDAGLQ